MTDVVEPDEELLKATAALLAGHHAYIVQDAPKGLLETLCVVQHALNQLPPNYQAGGSLLVHQGRVQRLIDECERKRPTGPGGKHGNRHTSECGCLDR